MSYDIVRTTLDAQPILFCSGRVSKTEIAALLGQLLPKVFGYATESGATLVGPPFVRYLEFTADEIALEAGLPVAPGAAAKGDIQLGELPAGPAASTIHTGPYDGLGAAHAALQAWVGEHGTSASGPPWEVYLTDPGEVPDRADWKTQVLLPIGP
ncbi:MAG: GyrI-like domain-containing protein [Nannocystales bacterium]